MRKLIVVGTAALLLLLVGCSDDDDTDSATSDTESTVEDTAADTTVTAPADTDVSAPGETTPVASDLTPEEAAYCAELQALPEGGDPGFEAFFAEHPEPTLEDWAEFLPGPIADMRAGIEPFAAIEPPPSMAEMHQDVNDALTAVAESFEEALAAAEAGDQAGYDAAEAANQNELTPAMEESMAVLGGACGLEG